MEIKEVSEQIPSSLQPFFQEYDFSRLDIHLHKPLLIERILAYGNRYEILWLIQTFGKASILSWLAQSGERRLPWRRYHLWCLIFGLPEPEKPHRLWTH